MKDMSHRWYMIAAGIGLALLGAGAWLFLPSDAARADAEALVELCGEEGDDAFCYEREVPKLLPQRTMQEVFGVIREIRRLDPSYQYCHVLAHKLGEEAVAEDPSRWLDLIPLNPPDGLCSNGFIHGLIVGRFRNDVLDEKTLEATIPDFARACEPRSDWHPSGLDQSICYHGLGHLFMFITNADIRTALDVCARVASSPSGDFMRVCTEGVFMQIYQPLEPDDFALIDLLPEEPSRENYRRMCRLYGAGNPINEGACLREAWPLFRDEVMRGEAVEFCAGQPNEGEEDKCYESVTTIIGRQSLGSNTGAAACAALPSERQSLCYTTVAQAILEEDRTQGEAALAFCAAAPEDIAGGCSATIASRAVWIFGADAENHRRFCEMLPAEQRRLCGR